MAGESNYGGNGSIYWKTRHLDEHGKPVAIKKKGNPKCADPVDEEKDHWIDIGDPYQLIAHDPIMHPTFFRVAMRFDTSPRGTVEDVRHEAIEAATSAPQGVIDFATRAARMVIIEAELVKLIKSAEEALRRIKSGERDATVEANIPIVRRTAIPSGGFEVTIRW